MSVNPLTLLPSFNAHLLWQLSYDASFWHIHQLASQMLFSLHFLPTLISFSHRLPLILILCNCLILKSKYLRATPQLPGLPVHIPFSCPHQLTAPVFVHLLPRVSCRLDLSWYEHLSNENLKVYRSQTNFQTSTIQISCSILSCRLPCSSALRAYICHHS